MSFEVNGTSVVRTGDDGETTGVAITFDAAMAQRIADALNESSTTKGLRAVKDPLTGRNVERLDIHDNTPLSAVVKGGRYVKIVGPYATAKMDTPGGRQIRALAAGSILPGDVTAGAARHLIDVGLAQLVEAGSAAEAYEAAPTQRQRVEMASPDVSRPTVGTPEPGSPAAAYDEDPVAAAQAAAKAGEPAVTQLSGAGLGLAGGEAGGGKPPRANASRDDWAAHAASKGAAGEEVAPVDQGGLSRDELRAKYGG
jgi:hypothetical protein